jgi:hypothetical protein
MHDFVWQVVKVCGFDVARLKPITYEQLWRRGVDW